MGDFSTECHYLDVEICREPLTGKNRILHVISALLKGATDIRAVLNLYCSILYEEKIKSLKDSFSGMYYSEDPLIKAITQTEEDDK